MSTPLVSVIMGTYNGTAYVLPAITSILKQTFRNFELLLVDDCSTDNVGELIAGFLQKHPDSRVRVLPRQEVNQGCAGTMNNLFAAASGKYIVVMDHDDISLPHRIEQAVSFLESHPDMDGCGTSHVILRSGLSNDLQYLAAKKNGQLLWARRGCCFCTF